MGLPKRIRLVFSALCVVLVAAGCGGGDAGSGGGGSEGSSAAGLTTLRVSVLPIMHVAPLYLAQDQGYFEDEGIKLELSTATTSAAIVPSIMAGEVEIGYGNMTSTILARAKGLPIVSIASADSAGTDPEIDTNAVIVKADSPYQTAADLEGKRVAVNALQASNYVTVRASADELGADSSAYQFVELPFPDMISSLSSGNIDAANVTEPFFTQARQSGDYRILYYTLNIAGTRPGFVSDSYYTSEAVLQEHGDAVEGFRRAIEKAKAYAAEHPDEMRDMVTDYLDLPAAVLPDITLPNWPTGDIPENDVDFMVGLMEEYGLLDEGQAPAYEDIVQK
jgi:NitT/TauT family transport system substrate-binding protein